MHLLKVRVFLGLSVISAAGSFETTTTSTHRLLAKLLSRNLACKLLVQSRAPFLQLFLIILLKRRRKRSKFVNWDLPSLAPPELGRLISVRPSVKVNEVQPIARHLQLLGDIEMKMSGEKERNGSNRIGEEVEEYKEFQWRRVFSPFWSFSRAAVSCNSWKMRPIICNLTENCPVPMSDPNS